MRAERGEGALEATLSQSNDSAGGVLASLAVTIRERRLATAGASYTRDLLDSGVERCARKFGEESVEAVVAALRQPDQQLVGEAADVLYHLLVLLECRGIDYADVEAALAARMGTSGHAEKAARGKPSTA